LIESETMPSEDERRELVPAIIATIVAAIGAFFLWSDVRNDSLVREDGMITSRCVTGRRNCDSVGTASSSGRAADRASLGAFVGRPPNTLKVLNALHSL